MCIHNLWIFYRFWLNFMDGTFWGCSCEYLINYWYFGCNISFEEERKKKNPTFDKCTGRQNSILYWNSKLGESADSVCVNQWCSLHGPALMGKSTVEFQGDNIVLLDCIKWDVTVFNSILSWWCVRKVVRGTRKHLQRNSHVINVAPLFFSLPQALFLLLLLLRANLQHAGDTKSSFVSFRLMIQKTFGTFLCVPNIQCVCLSISVVITLSVLQQNYLLNWRPNEAEN